MGKGGLNRILFSPAEVRLRDDGDREVLLEADDTRARHIRNVLGAHTGDSLRAAVAEEGVCDATLDDTPDTSVSEDTAHPLLLRLSGAVRARTLPAVTLCLAMPRPRATARAVRAAAQLGVCALVLTGASRVERSFFEAKLAQPAALAAAARDGVMQAAVDAHVPPIVLEPRLWLIEEHIPAQDAAVRVVLHPGSGKNLADVLQAAQASNVVLAVGPEGGWLDDEVAFFERVGFIRAGLGERILASEIAVTVAITTVHAHLAEDQVLGCDAPALLGAVPPP